MKREIKLPYKNINIEDFPNEIWVDAFGFDGIYEVSNFGRIKSNGRYVSNGKGERWVSERIRIQVLSSDGRLTCPFSSKGCSVSINVSALIFQSFNQNVIYDVKTHCIMHKNKLKRDNRLSNLKLETISNSHKLNHKKNLLPHLKENNKIRIKNYKKLTHKICVACSVKKEIILFEHGRNTCRECRKEQKRNDYKARVIQNLQINPCKLLKTFVSSQL